LPKRSNPISEPARGLIIAAPASGSGKTTIAIGLARALHRDGVAVSGFKVGPDYIDPAFLAAASRCPCPNIDLWAMRKTTVDHTAHRVFGGSEFVIGEGVMGLFDGAPDGTGSTADVASTLGLPVILIIDASGMAASAGALVSGFVHYRDDVNVAGVVFNRVGGPRHVRALRQAVEPLGIPVIGAIPRDAGLALPSRHLGLVQAREQDGLTGILDKAADLIDEHLDIGVLQALARSPVFERPAPDQHGPGLAPPGQRIAVANDEAFAFSYPDILVGWSQAGADVVPFSPLAGDGPTRDADAIYLPGGYPELHAGAIASNRVFMDGLMQAARDGVFIFGECGGYMVLGESLVDGNDERHAMAGLLPLETSFRTRKLALGYRSVSLAATGPLGPVGTNFRGHEFHYATITREGQGDRLFSARDAAGNNIGEAGLRVGSVMGSFVHLIDRAATQVKARKGPS